MAIRDLLRMGNPRLYEVARPVTERDWGDLPNIVDDMQDTMEAADGTGLAAPQIGVPLRLVIFEVDAIRSGAQGEGVARTVLVNPQIRVTDTQLQTGLEGCLSVPGMRGWVDRYMGIEYEGLSLQGEPIHRAASGFHAVVVQHEVDHLDGILYPMRIQDPKLFGFSEEITGQALELGQPDPCR